MKVNFTSLVAGILIATSGSLLASSVNLPFTFASGQKAKASEINSNFSTLANAISNIDARATSLETSTAIKPIPSISVTQKDLPVGSKITVNGAVYTIIQHDFPIFDSDEIYQIKMPKLGDFLADSTYGLSNSIYIYGRYKDQPKFPKDDWVTATINNGINGFDAAIAEDFSYSQAFTNSNTGRKTTNEFRQSISLIISLGDRTHLNISIGIPSAKIEGTNASRSADATGIIDVYPPTKTSVEREQIRLDSRALLSYVVITKK